MASAPIGPGSGCQRSSEVWLGRRLLLRLGPPPREKDVEIAVLCHYASAVSPKGQL